MHFFFYGTLLDGSDNPVAAWVHGHLRLLGSATVPGTICAVPDPDGWYPALLPGGGVVHGRLYEAGQGFGASDLARLDAYEDCDPDRPETSLYVREALMAVAADGAPCEAQAYRFNRALPEGSVPIPEGDFRAWLAGRRES